MTTDKSDGVIDIIAALFLFVCYTAAGAVWVWATLVDPDPYTFKVLFGNVSLTIAGTVGAYTIRYVCSAAR